MKIANFYSAIFACLTISACSTVAAENTNKPSLVQNNLKGCDNPNALGVSRTIILDKEPKGQKYGRVQYEGLKLNPKEVVLTFDDGPNLESTPLVLNALKAECAKATFFMVGNNLESNPQIAKLVINNGHTAGIHSLDHKNINNLSEIEQAKDLDANIEIANKVLGKDFAPFYRFPFLANAPYTTEALKQKGFIIFSIDSGITDWEPSSKEQLNTRLLDGLKANNGGIILMHDAQMQTALALPSMLNTIKENGYKLVFVDFKRD